MGAKAKKADSQKTAFISRPFSGKHDLGPRSKFVMASFVILFGLIATTFLILSRANPLFSTGANDVVLEYVLPHNDSNAGNNLGETTSSPFTLYGNGLLVCGQQADNQFTAPRDIFDAEGREHSSATPNARILTNSEMVSLIDRVRGTGFEGLSAEYYRLPVAEQMHVIRLVLRGGEKQVLYYNDVNAPVAYTSTLQIMQDECNQATAKYQADTVTLRSKSGADTHGHATQQLKDTTPGKDHIKNALDKSIAAKRQNDTRRAAGQQVEDFDEYAETVTGQAARDLQKTSNGQYRLFVSQDGVNYEVGVDPELPKPSNPLTVDVKKLRGVDPLAHSGEVSLLDKWHLTNKASAFAVPNPEPWRIVYLYPSDSTNDDKLSAARNRGHNMDDWYCHHVGRCGAYQGVVVIRGSQTKAFYNTCHWSTCPGNQGLNIMYNVSDKDQATVAKSGVITLIVPSWDTNTYERGACGWGMQGGNLSIVDLYSPEANCNLTKSIAHEYAHNFGLGHNADCTYRNLMDGPPGCNYQNNCDIASSTQPVCIFSSTQTDKLQADYQHFPVSDSVVSGRVYDSITGTGIAGVTITTCVSNKPSVVTDANGRWSVRLTTGTGFCGRVASGLPAGLANPKLNNNPERATAATYEYQVSDKNCYKNAACNTYQQVWDRSVDTGYDFAYTRTTGSLYFIQTLNTASGNVEVQRAPAASTYATVEPTITLPLSTADAANGTFQVVGDNIYFLKTKNTASGKLEITVYSRSSNYASPTTAVKSPSLTELSNVRPVFDRTPSDTWYAKTLNAGQNGQIAVLKLTDSATYLYGAGPISESESTNGKLTFTDDGQVRFFKTRSTASGYVTLLGYTRLNGWTETIHGSTYFSNTIAGDFAFAMDRFGGRITDDVIAVRYKNTASGKVEIMFDRGPTYGNLDKQITTGFSTVGSTNGTWVISE